KMNQHRIMRFTPSNRNQFKFRSADAQLRSFVDHSVRFVAENIIGAESRAEELLAEDTRPVHLLLEIFPIVLSPIKLGTRIQAAEIRMSADMVPVCVSNEHGCQWREPRCIGLQSFVGASCEIRACARVNGDELTAVPGNNEIVFREFEAG